MRTDQSQRNEGPTLRSDMRAHLLGARVRVVQKAIGEPHVRRGPSLLDRSIVCHSSGIPILVQTCLVWNGIGEENIEILRSSVCKMPLGSTGPNVMELL